MTKKYMEDFHCSKCSQKGTTYLTVYAGKNDYCCPVEAEQINCDFCGYTDGDFFDWGDMTEAQLSEFNANLEQSLEKLKSGKTVEEVISENLSNIEAEMYTENDSNVIPDFDELMKDTDAYLRFYS